MKKRNLNSLKLNKKTISSLKESGKITGGTGTCPAVTYFICPIVVSLLVCPDDSADGCTGTPDETMTCADWSCGCPMK
ncbi:hypothetical protein H2O64_16080 [Kordia sp. YSTF-M3]|uniref:Bacteriocin n=1 Tax=Kordia aestuariivivens TaxID=2759037 RepID=A0ABR7QCB0_9FLAO|nr:hypothetical protein [Kordia aestuariivivens]MBC8756196.1 hypothetical protein [Kordia aestuariivivens]